MRSIRSRALGCAETDAHRSQLAAGSHALRAGNDGIPRGQRPEQAWRSDARMGLGLRLDLITGQQIVDPALQSHLFDEVQGVLARVEST